MAYGVHHHQKEKGPERNHKASCTEHRCWEEFGDEREKIPEAGGFIHRLARHHHEKRGPTPETSGWHPLSGRTCAKCVSSRVGGNHPKIACATAHV